MGDLATDTIKLALTGNTSGYLRLTGHSLGNQLATIVAGKLADAGYPVKRLALLDPFWSKNGKAYISNQWTGAACRTLVKDLIVSHATVVEQFKSSGLGGLIAGDENLDMRKMNNFVRVWPDNIGATDQTHQHVYAFIWYHLSFGKAVPTNNGMTIGAAATDTMIKSLMNYGKTSTYYYYTTSGKNTTAITDDAFTQKAGVSTY